MVIKNDDISEENETFSLIIMPESLPNDVTVGNISRSTVIIQDDDCKFNCCRTYYGQVTNLEILK